MGAVKHPEPVNLICGILAFDETWLELACETIAEHVGEIDSASDIWPFGWTDYYESETGEHIVRQFVSFKELIAQDDLARIKRLTNELEIKLAARNDVVVPRPVNLDPGYVSDSKLVLATTKDYAHRIYIGKGIYAEVTLHWHRGGFEPWPWTYLDYRSENYLKFFGLVRKALRDKRISNEQPGEPL